MSLRLDKALALKKLTRTRSQAESYIKLGLVKVNGETISQPARMVSESDSLEIVSENQYVSRAALKLESVAKLLNLDFKGKVVLDVGSSTGGFTDFALRNGAEYAIDIEVGVDQLHPSLRNNQKIELHERTDIRDVRELSRPVDMVVIDVSFISLRDVMPSVVRLVNSDTEIVSMFKPQFETGPELRHKGVIKNDKIRRQLLSDFENWLKQNKLVVVSKADSLVAGSKGNKERFYLIRIEK